MSEQNELVTFTCNMPGAHKTPNLILKVSLASNDATKEEKVGKKVSIEFRGGIYQTRNKDIISAIERCNLYGSMVDRIENLPTMEDGEYTKKPKPEYGPPTDYLIRQEQDKREHKQMPAAPDPNAVQKAQEAELPQKQVFTETKLKKTKLGELKSLAKLMGLAGKIGEKKVDLIGRILEAQK